MNLLRRINEDPEKKDNVYIRTFYTGFGRPDNRSWLGFHDGVSNIESKDRFKAISINNSDLPVGDRWTANGTYLAFLRIAINLDLWEKIPKVKQERIVGRDKISGCPLIGIDEKTGNNIVVRGCPSPGTFEVTEEANKIFREHPVYGSQRSQYGPVSDNKLEKSHIGRVYKKGSHDSESYRIFRQGYEFLEAIGSATVIRAGLNFVSFQRAPDRLHNILIHGLGASEFGGGTEQGKEKDGLLSVRAAGMYFVPPSETKEQFPGESIFE
jgi:deferrochelatase/peroxidase EfeB